MRKFLTELWTRDPILAGTGWLMFSALAVMAVIGPFDSRTVTGLNPWIKPSKFALSVGIYLFTVAWLLGYLPGPRWGKLAIRWGVSLLMIGEMYCIISQAARGTASHFNTASAYDIVIFSVMGGMITLNGALDLLLLGLYFQRGIKLEPGHLWGIRLGLLVFILGSIEGVVMINNNGHTVGAADGGPGLPYLDWSTVAGDLRVAHLMGLHALQAIPLFGWMVSVRQGRRSASRQVALVATFALIYVILAARLFMQAMAGRPLFPS